MRTRARSGRASCFGCFEDADLRVAHSVGVIIDVHLLYIGLALFEIEMLDVVLLTAVNINGFLVQENQRAREINFTDYVGPAGDIDDDEIVAADGSQADGVGGVGFMRPVIKISGKMQIAGLRQPRTNIREVDRAKAFTGGDGQFERGAFQMIDENFEIIWLNEPMRAATSERPSGRPPKNSRDSERTGQAN